jgi:hypothetical protein
MEILDLEMRVRALERCERRARGVAGLAVVAFAAAAAFGLHGAGDEVSARRFVVRGPDGKERVVIGEEEGAVGLFVRDESGRSRASVRWSEKGVPEVAVMDEAGVGRVLLSIRSETSGGLFLRDEKSRLRGWFITSKGQPVLDLMGDNEKSRIGMSVLDKGSAGLSLFNADQAVRAGLIHNADDSVRLTLRTGPLKDEVKVAELKVFPEGAAKLEIVDPKGRSSLVFGLMPDGASGLNILGADRKPRVSLAATPETSVLQLLLPGGRKTAEVHAIDPAAVPEEMRGKAALTSIVLEDENGKETFRAPAEKGQKK